MTPPALRDLLADSLALWGVQGQVRVDEGGVVAEAGETRLTVSRAEPGDAPIHWWVTRDGRDWLRAQGLPVWHYRTKMYGGLPTQGGTVAHKADYIRYLREQAGLQIVRAYGNAATDVQAYAEAGLPPQQTWIIGEHAGSQGTQALGGDYLEHLASVVAQTPPAACRQSCSPISTASR